MSLELTASGLAEDRDVQAYVAALTYSLVYETARDAPERREQFTVPIYTRVRAVPVAALSVRGRVPAGARCDTNLTLANSTGTVLVELHRLASVPFSLCDLEGYPTNQPQSPKAVTNVTGLLRRLGAPYSPLQLAEPVISFAGGALYLAEVVPPALGRWELSLFLGEEQIPQTANLSTFCPMGQVPMPDGDSCGCAAGTVLKPGAAALMAAGVWEADEGLCEACPVTTWSVVGADACDHCAAGYYYSEPAAKGSSPCSPCPSFAVCSPYTTLETLQLRSNMWRLTNRTLDARSCATSGDVRRSPCMGGSQSADETGSGYCAQGHEGPLCGVCTEVNHHYDVDQMTCIDCGSSLYWLEPLLKYLLPLLAIAILMAMGAGLIERRPERLRFLWKRLIKIRLLAVDANVFTRLKVRATPNRTDRVAALLIPSPSECVVGGGSVPEQLKRLLTASLGCTLIAAWGSMELGAIEKILVLNSYA